MIGARSGGKPPAMPRVLTIFKKCTEHGVTDGMMRKMHFNDLYVLLLSLDADNLRRAIAEAKNAKRAKSGNRDTVTDISEQNAINFLKGGGLNG